MFNIRLCSDGKIYTVYGVRTDTFLINRNGLWMWVYMHDCELVTNDTPAPGIMTHHE